MTYTNISEVALRDIKTQFKKNKEYSCTLPFASDKTDIFLSHLLRAVLEELKQENLFVHLEYVLNELAMNASKANSKRIYFKTSGLDINNPTQYEKGMKTFKSDALKNFESFEKYLIEEKSFININIISDGRTLIFRIINNSPMLPGEENRINQSLQSAAQFEDLTEVFNKSFDQSEGRGLGLIIIMLMLRKLDLNENAISFKNEGNCSITSLQIPMSILSKDHGKIIAEAISSEIENMPQFPESITALQEELGNPSSSFNSIAGKINSDPALTAEILRIANSPVYRSRSEIKDIEGAVRMIGLLGIKSVLYNYGVNQIMQQRYSKQVIKEINDHSYYVAKVASFIASYKGLGKKAEDIYVAALLHDMGKIIVNSLNRGLEKQLKDLCTRRYIPVSVLEDLTRGYNHSLIGSEIAEKWSFPEKYICAIGCHHIPLDAPEEYKDLVYTIYLGNEIYHYQRGERNYHDINYMVLEHFGLEDDDHFMEFIKTLKVEGFSEI